MKIIADMDDASYFEKRAIELIHEASADRLTVISCRLAKSEAKAIDYSDAYHQKMNKVIQLITLARAVE